jgi:hypothetical protein
MSFYGLCLNLYYQSAAGLLYGSAAVTKGARRASAVSAGKDTNKAKFIKQVILEQGR